MNSDKDLKREADHVFATKLILCAEFAAVIVGTPFLSRAVGFDLGEAGCFLAIAAAAATMWVREFSKKEDK